MENTIKHEELNPPLPELECAEDAVRTQIRILGHAGFGVTELRVFEPRPLVAYVDNENVAAELCRKVSNTAPGIYIGVQPRPLQFFDMAPNCWRLARSGIDGNCACDADIEYITTVFFDVDVVSPERSKGHPASDEELARSLPAAHLLCRESGLAFCTTICGSGNGLYVLARILPIAVDSDEVSLRFRQFCRQLTGNVSEEMHGVKFDDVYNRSRVMRVMGTVNRKGTPVPGRPHRRAYFVTEPIFAQSVALHHMILNTEIEQNMRDLSEQTLPRAIRCDLSKIESCLFIQHCRQYPERVSEPQWWGMITNLAHLEGGPALVHEISRLDQFRYDYASTQRVIERVISSGYRPMSCRALMNCSGACRGSFTCPRIRQCPARAPMYMASLYSVYTD